MSTSTTSADALRRHQLNTASRLGVTGLDFAVLVILILRGRPGEWLRDCPLALLQKVLRGRGAAEETSFRSLKASVDRLATAGHVEHRLDHRGSSQFRVLVPAIEETPTTAWSYWPLYVKRTLWRRDQPLGATRKADVALLSSRAVVERETARVLFDRTEIASLLAVHRTHVPTVLRELAGVGALEYREVPGAQRPAPRKGRQPKLFELRFAVPAYKPVSEVAAALGSERVSETVPAAADDPAVAGADGQPELSMGRATDRSRATSRAQGQPATMDKAKTDEDWRAEALAVRAQCWKPDLIDAAIRAVNAQRPTNVTAKQALQRFYAPAYRLQVAYGDATLTKYALDAINRWSGLHEADALTGFGAYLGGIYRKECKRRGGKPATHAAVRQVELVAAVEAHQQDIERHEHEEDRRVGEQQRKEHEKRAAAVVTRFLGKASSYDAPTCDGHIHHIAQQFHRHMLGDYYEVRARLRAAVEHSVITWADAQRLSVEVRRPSVPEPARTPTREEEVSLDKADARSHRHADARAKLFAPRTAGAKAGSGSRPNEPARPTATV